MLTYTLFHLCGGLVPLSFHATSCNVSHVISDMYSIKVLKWTETLKAEYTPCTYIRMSMYGGTMVYMTNKCTYIHAINTH